MKKVYILVPILIVLVVLWTLNKRVFPVDFGVSFSRDYASALGQDWQEVYTAMMEELQPEHIRIAATWREIEPKKGEFDFSAVDWQMDTALAHGAKVLLVVGQKAPRWPECHIPGWVEEYGDEESKEYLLGYVRAVVERYKDHEALEIWQVENEPFIRFAFGDCEGYNKEHIYDEIEIVRELDPEKKIMVTDSGELGVWYGAARAGDIFGTTLYRIVRTPGNHIWTYDWVPASVYYLRARLFGVDMDNFFIAELQAEPWFGEGNPHDTPVEEQEETMNPKRLEKHMDYVTHIGASRAYLWGVEWWYMMKEVHGDARYWDMVKERLL
ncbi:MAG: cellulase family glycosylhydrolase [Candidatus Magasanikbacteria bacterium]|jgi:hypothetical protein|nr:cellulase family glycosylhydrolase [Candidatus Magasanikbacteria bacterium]MBT4071595.1 cellulase family glycosylhydrolase [Candidatus Magasanikbacteria bacterium]